MYVELTPLPVREPHENESNTNERGNEQVLNENNLNGPPEISTVNVDPNVEDQVQNLSDSGVQVNEESPSHSRGNEIANLYGRNF